MRIPLSPHGNTPTLFKTELLQTWNFIRKPSYELNDGPGKLNERIAQITGLTLENYV